MMRRFVGAVSVALMIAGCGAPSPPSSGVERGSSTSAVSTTTLAMTETVSTALGVTTSSPAVPSTTRSSRPTTTIGETPSHELGIWAAPADGQWFAEVPIPWIFAVRPPESDAEAGGVPGASGWTRDAAVVTVNGIPADHEWCTGCMGQRGSLLAWRMTDGDGDPSGWTVGENTVAIVATFNDGTVVEDTRTIHYDPTLAVLTGWMVDLDQADATITIAASTYESAEEDGAEAGPVTSVVAYPVRDGAAFVLLDVESSGQPPDATIGFDAFADLVLRAQAGECSDCFFASWANQLFVESDAEHGAHYFVVSLKDGEIQQMEQVWSP